jgi:hypothetical protein
VAFVVGVAALVAAMFFLISGDHPTERIYDCGMAEWHPDIPPAVKEACRNRAREYWREQQERINKEKTTI